MEIRIFHIGNKQCPHNDPDIQKAFNKLMEKLSTVENETKNFKKHHLIFGANYDREDDLLRAAQKIYSSDINPYNIKSKDFIKYTDVGDQPYPSPDLFIRTAFPYGIGRTGNFMPIMSETRIFFTPVLSPELTINDFIEGAAKFSHPLARYKSSENSHDSSIEMVRPMAKL